MQRQYNELKAEYPNAILFFRLGDFYEMFGDDAVEAAKILGIALTSRDKKSDNPLPMCGVPHHAMENYLAKLTLAGKKVAIAEQVSDPTLPGLTKREVVRIVTPGTTFSEQVLQAEENQFLAAVAEQNGIFGVGIADLSTGDFLLSEQESFEAARDEIQRMQVKEVVLSPQLFSREDFQQVFPVTSLQEPPKEQKQFLQDHLGTKTLKGFGLEEKPVCIAAAALLVAFLQETQKGKVQHLKHIRLDSQGDHIPLDPETIRNLELFQDSEGGKEGSLVQTIDETQTAMGGRKLRMNVLRPLKNQNTLEERLDAVEELTQDQSKRVELKKNLKEVADMERLISKISCGRANPRDLLSLKTSLEQLPKLAALLGEVKSKKLLALQKKLREL